jgi:2-phosphoglycerate kinase
MSPTRSHGKKTPDRPSNPEIVITGSGDGLPFSKGVLSQSLLATALDPAVAFALSREIEGQLAGLGTREISRSDLRNLVCALLRDRLGAETAERYLLWRRYQEPDRPVVILLGGTSGVGKTTLSLEVARRLGIGRVLSTDSIRQIMRILLSPELVPSIYGSSYDAYKLLPRDAGEEVSVIDGFRAQARAVSVGVRASLDRTVAESANLVIDGVSLAPSMVDVAAYEDRAEIVFLVVAALGDDALRRRFVARATDQKRRVADRYLDNLEGILAIQRHLIDSANRYGVPIIDNVGFESSVGLIIEHVMDALRRREKLMAT